GFDRFRFVVVRRDAARSAGDVRGDRIEQHLLEQRLRPPLHVGRLRIDLLLKTADDVRGQPDRTVAYAALEDVEVVRVDCEAIEIGRSRRTAEPPDLQNLRSFFEVFDVPHAIDERRFRRVDAHTARNGDFAGGRTVDGMSDDL